MASSYHSRTSLSLYKVLRGRAVLHSMDDGKIDHVSVISDNGILHQRFLIKAVLPLPPGTSGSIWKHFWLPQLGSVSGNQWIEGRDGPKHPSQQQGIIQPKMPIVTKLRTLTYTNFLKLNYNE